MPDKEGSDDEKKSTKSVVNKKQKLMMGEEGYDIARDMGRVRPSKDKKDATTMPPSKEMKKTQKVNKGPSALDIVKKKYKGQIMNVGKKKANEELDLTQVAEAFGGYIIESEIRKIGDKTYIYPSKGEEKKAKEVVRQFKKKGSKPKSEPSSNIDDFIASDDPFSPEKGAAKAKQVAKKQIEKDLDFDPRFDAERKEREGQFSTGPTGQKFKEPTPKLQKKGSKTPIGTKLGDTTIGGEVKTTFDPRVINPKFKKKKPIDPDEIRAARQFKKDLGGETPLPGETEAGKSELKKTASAKIEKPKPEPPKIGQFQGPQMTPLQKSKKFNRPSIADPKNITGADPQTGQPMFMRPGVLDKSGRPKRLPKASPVELRQTRQAVKDLENDPKEKTIVSPVTGGRLPADSPQATQYYRQSPAGRAKIEGIDVDTGKPFNMSDPEQYDKYMKLIGSSKRAKDSKKFRNQDSTITKTGGITKVGTPTKDGSIISQNPLAMAVKKADKLVQRNPVLGGLSGLAAYDVGKGIFSKIMNLRGPGLRGGTVGRRTAGTFTAT